MTQVSLVRDIKLLKQILEDKEAHSNALADDRDRLEPGTFPGYGETKP